MVAGGLRHRLGPPWRPVLALSLLVGFLSCADGPAAPSGPPSPGVPVPPPPPPPAPPPPPPPPPTQAAIDREALTVFYSATGGANWTNNDNWLTDAPLGDWHGVSVNDSGSVTRLRLGDNGLMGPMPPEIGDLASLEVLLLGSGSHGTGEEESNELTGPIPAELGTLASLRILTLADNSLSGPIPPELGRLSSLTRLMAVR